MCAPLYDDKGHIRYFIGAQIDVTGLVEEGMGIESFRAILQKDQENSEDADRTRTGDVHRTKQVKVTLDRLQELSQMFSHDEMEAVGRGRGSDEASTDAGSIRSGVPTSVKNRGQAKRLIGVDEMLGDGLNLSQLSIHSNPGHSLPGAYQHVRFPLLFPLFLANFML